MEAFGTMKGLIRVLMAELLALSCNGDFIISSRGIQGEPSLDNWPEVIRILNPKPRAMRQDILSMEEIFCNLKFLTPVSYSSLGVRSGARVPPSTIIHYITSMSSKFPSKFPTVFSI